MSAVDRIELFDLLVPAKTAKASPVTFTLSFTPGIVMSGTVFFPNGCQGLVGWQLLYGSNVLIPNSGVAYARQNNGDWPFDVNGLPSGDQYVARCYNTDTNPHTLQLRLDVDEIPPPAATPGTPADLSAFTESALDQSLDAGELSLDQAEAAEVEADEVTPQ